MRTYLVVSQHTCKRAVNGLIPLGGSTAPIPLLGSEFFFAIPEPIPGRGPTSTPTVKIHACCTWCRFSASSADPSV